MFRSFFSGLPTLVYACVRGRMLLWHALAIVLTYILVMSGFDFRYFEATRGSALLSLTLPAAILGFFVPILAPVGLYVYGEVRNRVREKNAGIAMAQAGIIASLVAATYKAFTGRWQPEFYTHLSTVDISRAFHFGFFEHGIFWGWPSSHTAVACAGSVALVMMYVKNMYARAALLLYALYIAVGVSVSIHWFSDAVAGAIIGSVIGYVVGKKFLRAQ